MSPLPTHMRDRWQNRADTPPGKGTVYWHILMGGYPEVRSLAQKAQNQLAGFTGLHMTPLDWLHMSVLVVGSAEEITAEQMERMLQSASRALAKTPPISVTLGRLLYHPEAVMLGVDSAEALTPMMDAATMAAKTVVGRDGYTTSGSGHWLPHVTLCYSTTHQHAEPVIETLGTRLPECHVTIDKLTLVVQRGPEREWDWHPFGSIYLKSH